MVDLKKALDKINFFKQNFYVGIGQTHSLFENTLKEMFDMLQEAENEAIQLKAKILELEKEVASLKNQEVEKH